MVLTEEKPEIVLILINDRNYVDFFTGLKYLNNAKETKVDVEDIIKNKIIFNNLLNIKNEDIIENINLNFRLILLKDFFLTTYYSEEQISEYNSYLVVHNNAILSFLFQKIESSPYMFLELLVKNSREF